MVTLILLYLLIINEMNRKLDNQDKEIQEKTIIRMQNRMIKEHESFREKHVYTN